MSEDYTFANLTDDVLLSRLKDTEHDFVERKSNSSKHDWLQTAVAFANSAPTGLPAILFVGVDDNGAPQQGIDKLESLQKSLSSVLDRAFPSIYRQVRPLLIGNLGCLAVLIPGSVQRPHFAGKSYVRVGPETKEASGEQFELLVHERQSKVYELSKWLGKKVWFTQFSHDSILHPMGNGMTTLLECNSHYFTFLIGADRVSFPLRRLDLSFNHDHECLALEINL